MTAFVFALVAAAFPALRLPAESWMSVDLGGAVAGATVNNANTAFTIQGDGTGIWGNGDSFRFVFLRAKGDCEIVARLNAHAVAPPATMHPLACAGVMIRQNLTSSSMNAAMVHTAANSNVFQWRLVTAGVTADRRNTATTPLPRWFRLRRSGNVFSAYYAPDAGGKPGAWTKQGGDVTIYMNDPVYVGLCVCSYAHGTLTTAVFDGIATTGTLRPGAGIIIGQLR